MWKLWILFILMFELTGCQQARFGAGGNGIAQPPTPEPRQPPIDEKYGEIFRLEGQCTTDAQPRLISVNSSQNGRLDLKGEICPLAFGKLNVLFLVDYSGSMKTADPADTLGLSCGRLRSARRILARLKAARRPSDTINVGEITFARTAQQRLEMQDINQFDSLFKLNRSNFCGWESSPNGSTNYQSAFNLARQTLANATGNTVVYLLSDGLPTISNGNEFDNNDTQGLHKTAGLQAVNTLRSSISNVSISTVFLNRSSNSAMAEGYLQSISDQLRIVSEAADLADKAVELSIPTVELGNGKPTATLTVEGTSINQSVAIESFQKDQRRPGVWLFQTAPFMPAKQPGTIVRNKLTVTAKGQDGQNHSNTFWLDVQSQ